MSYSYTEKKRIRKSFSKLPHTMEEPFLLAIQLDSYRKFTQEGVEPANRNEVGLHLLLSRFSRLLATRAMRH